MAAEGASRRPLQAVALASRAVRFLPLMRVAFVPLLLCSRVGKIVQKLAKRDDGREESFY